MAEKTLRAFADILDKFDESGDLEIDYQDGIITITLNSGKQFIVNRHAPSQQIWLSSPISGGLHFSYDDIEKKWKLADGRTLDDILSNELKKLAGIEVVFL
jgi:iron donor protein CyaY